MCLRASGAITILRGRLEDQPDGVPGARADAAAGTGPCLCHDAIILEAYESPSKSVRLNASKDPGNVERHRQEDKEAIRNHRSPHDAGNPDAGR